jgi:hypothetical protein
MHFSHLLTSFPIPVEKIFNLLSKPDMHHLLHLVVTVKSLSLQCFLMRAKHMKVRWSEIWTVKGMIYGIKYQFLNGDDCSSSSVWSRIVMEKEDPFGQKSAMMIVNYRLQFLLQHDAVPYIVDCFSFLLTVFENWSIHIP